MALAAVACGDDHHDAEDAALDAASSPAQELCNCLLVSCHDEFHAEYGESDEVAIPACETAAESVPSAGMPVTSGDFIECRAAMCDMGDCAAALGGVPCM